MEDHSAGRRRSWLSIGAGLGVLLAVGLAAACGPGSTTAEPSATTPSDATATQVGPTQVVPATTAAPPPTQEPTLVPVPAYQIIVKVSTPPSTTHPCNPAGSIEVYGTGFPVTVTHEWRYRAVTVGTGNGTQLGPAVTHGYNVEGGKAISSEKLPAGMWQVQLRVTSPKLIVSQWVTHNPCAG